MDGDEGAAVVQRKGGSTGDGRGVESTTEFSGVSLGNVLDEASLGIVWRRGGSGDRNVVVATGGNVEPTVN